MKSIDQSSVYGVFYRADRVYGIPFIPICARREYKLFKRDLWRGHTCKYCSMVRLREENLLGNRKGDY